MLSLKLEAILQCMQVSQTLLKMIILYHWSQYNLEAEKHWYSWVPAETTKDMDEKIHS